MERYEIEELLVGQGGFGKVRKGKDTILERKIAVKLLDPVWAAADNEDKERFRREARTLAKLTHPNIPAIYDVLFGDDKFEIVFQFVEGRTLRDMLDEEGELSLSECRIWFDQIASALQHAHENDIIHRDIKPENMIVSPDRRHCYLVDFGIALSKEEMDRLTGSDDWIGTPGYMSPEQENGEPLDSSDDLYVLGGCLYEMLSGHKIQQGDYQSLHAINELIPPAIDNLVLRCIAAKPRRLSSAGEFRSLLRSALHGHRTLSETLAGGQLHDVVSVIREMSAQQFMDMKVGQRLLILQKCQDIVQEQDRRLIAARIEFLEVLTRLGIFLPSEDYHNIIEPAINYGFGAVAEDGVVHDRGEQTIRDALQDAASTVGNGNHHVIVEAFLLWLGDLSLEDQKTGFYHALRLLINVLMANPECSDEDAPSLADVLRRVNELQRAKTRKQSAEPDAHLVAGGADS